MFLLSYWPSVSLAILLLIGIGLCLKRLDCMATDEMKAFISIVFGFVASCLLLSFIWIIQRKSLQRPWPNQSMPPVGRDLPSLDPRGATRSGDLMSTAAYGVVQPSEVATAEACIEFDAPPPNYEDALIHSKPLIRWDLYKQRKDTSDLSRSQAISSIGGSCLCTKQLESRHQVAHSFLDDHHLSMCPPRAQGRPRKASMASGNHKAQLAICIMRGFGHLDLVGTTAAAAGTGAAVATTTGHQQRPIAPNRKRSHAQPPQCDICPGIWWHHSHKNYQQHNHHYHHQEPASSSMAPLTPAQRKTSFTQLDAKQLMMACAAPPKYGELYLNEVGEGGSSSDANNTCYHDEHNQNNVESTSERGSSCPSDR